MRKIYLLTHEYDKRYIGKKRKLYVFDNEEKAKVKQTELQAKEDSKKIRFSTYEISELPVG